MTFTSCSNIPLGYSQQIILKVIVILVNLVIKLLIYFLILYVIMFNSVYIIKIWNVTNNDFIQLTIIYYVEFLNNKLPIID